MPLDIFIPGVGQHENIGDVILRRQLLDRMRHHGPMHVYVGDSSPAYERALGLRSTDSIYRSFLSWYKRALKGTLDGSGTYVFKPGEIQLTIKGMKEHVSVLPLVLAARSRGNPVIRIGSGSRNFARVPRALIGPSIRASSIVRWRDGRTAAYLGGEVMPDLAFSEGSDLAELASGDGARDILVVSMRSDRGHTPSCWVEVVRNLAETEGLRIVAVSQVLRDNAKTVELAERLGGEAITWDGEDHADQEELLRHLYRQARVAVSDRLHVLIAAFTEGAVPAALLTEDSDKVRRHFEAVGIRNVSFVLGNGVTRDDVESWFGSLWSQRDTMFRQLSVARSSTEQVFALVAAKFENR